MSLERGRGFELTRKVVFGSTRQHLALHLPYLQQHLPLAFVLAKGSISSESSSPNLSDTPLRGTPSSSMVNEPAVSQVEEQRDDDQQNQEDAHRAHPFLEEI
jgi:hypothetical protein